MKTQGMLADSMTDYEYANQIKALPMVLDENGNELYLSQENNLYLSENILDLSEDTVFNSVGYQGQNFGG
jgi:hypothetical protein